HPGLRPPRGPGRCPPAPPRRLHDARTGSARNAPETHAARKPTILLRELSASHEVAVARSRLDPPVRDGPDDERGTTTRIAGDEEPGHRCRERCVGQEVVTMVARHPQTLEQWAWRRPREADGQQHEVSGDDGLAAGDGDELTRAVVIPGFDAHGVHLLHRAAVAGEAGDHDAEIARSALL